MLKDNIYENGIILSQLKVGVVSTVTAQYIKVNLAFSGQVSGKYIWGRRYGKGEVGEFVLVEGQQSICLGRITEIKLPERDRTGLSQEFDGSNDLDAIGYIQLLGTISRENLKVQAGVAEYPRLGDRVFSAPVDLIASIPELMGAGDRSKNSVMIELGSVTGGVGGKIKVTPEKLFGRHCAVLGATGGGKSWTITKLLEECARFKGSKLLLLDATSEYRNLDPLYTEHWHIGAPIHKHEASIELQIPPTDFIESDFIAMFDPSGKVQSPKLREAIKSLRLVELEPEIFPNGVVEKVGKEKKDYRRALNKNNNSSLVDNPSQPFDVSNLAKQIVQECCWDNGDSWGNANNDLGHCSSLLTRIQSVINSASLKAVFKADADLKNFSDAFKEFWESDKKIFRICLSDISYEFNAREVLANVIGRSLLKKAREDYFRKKPLITVVDEAHNFLGKRVGSEDNSTRLDSFELIAKEGRKYGLNILLATQRPRDITEGVISQMGTLLVHRLTNERDRDVVEKACGEIDRSAASFLPNLQQGELAVVGVDFPIPMTIQIDPPASPPASDGASFQSSWVEDT